MEHSGNGFRFARYISDSILQGAEAAERLLLGGWCRGALGAESSQSLNS